MDQKKTLAPMVSGIGQFHTNEPLKANRRPYLSISMDDIRALVDNPQNKPKDEAQWFIPSSVQSRAFKEQEANGLFSCLWADFDDDPNPINEISSYWSDLSGGCDAEFYSSKSATKDRQKSRIIIPLTEPISGTDWVICQQILNDKLKANGFIPDRAAERPAQLCYLPNRGEFYEAVSVRDKKLGS